MSEEKEYYPLDVISSSLKKGESTSTTVKLVDAGSESAKILVGNFGSDKEGWLDEGKVDYRRFTHLDPLDPYWCSYFRLMPPERGGNWARKFVEEYENHMYSVDGRHKKLTVDMQKAVSGKDVQPKDKKKRSITDRLLGRNKDEE